MKGIVEKLLSTDTSPEAIAIKCNMPRERITAILEGAPLSLRDVRLLSDGLAIPIYELIEADAGTSYQNDLGVRFRDPEQQDHETRSKTVSKVARYVDASLSVLGKNIADTDWLADFEIEEETYSEAKRLAELFRSIFVPGRNIDPLFDLPAILEERCGVIIAMLEKSRYEGASVISQGRPFAFISRRFVGRMLFTLAHELGHILVHHRDGHDAIFDKPSNMGMGRNTGRQEAFCNAFASVLLMPEAGVGKSLQVIRQQMNISEPQIGDVEINLLARYYGVSFDVAAFRCEQLDLMPTGGAFSLADEIRKKFGSAEKRAEQLELPKRQEPHFQPVAQSILSACLNKIETGEISTGWASENFGVSIEDLQLANSLKLAYAANHH